MLAFPICFPAAMQVSYELFSSQNKMATDVVSWPLFMLIEWNPIGQANLVHRKKTVREFRYRLWIRNPFKTRYLINSLDMLMNYAWQTTWEGIVFQVVIVTLKCVIWRNSKFLFSLLLAMPSIPTWCGITSPQVWRIDKHILILIYSYQMMWEFSLFFS